MTCVRLSHRGCRPTRFQGFPELDDDVEAEAMAEEYAWPSLPVNGGVLSLASVPEDESSGPSRKPWCLTLGGTATLMTKGVRARDSAETNRPNEAV